MGKQRLKTLREDKRFRIASYVFHFFVFPCVINFCINQFFIDTNPGVGITMFASGYIFSYILALLINALLTAITTSSFATAVTFGAVAYVFSAAQYIKISMADNPVYLSDLHFFKSFGNTIGDVIAESSMGEIIAEMALQLVEYGVIITVFCLLSWLMRFRLKYLKGGIYVGAASLAVLLFFSLPVKPFTDFTLNVFFKYDERTSDYPTTSLKYYKRYGVISGMYGQATESRIYKPDDYDTDELDGILGAAADKADDSFTGNWGDVNIIMVFSESFWDINQTGEFAFSKELTGNFDRLSEIGQTFNMISPTFGGLSSNSEYEVFTGSNLAFYSPGFIPYTQMYTNPSYEGTPNFFDVLQDNGYYTKIISAWEESLFDRKKVYSFFGIDDTDFREELKNVAIKAKRPSDDYLADCCIDFIASDEYGDGNYFVMLNTAQLHMPYYESKYSHYTVDVTKAPEYYNNSMLAAVRCYAQGLYDADRQLGKLYDYICTLDERTIIIFYGDHLPNLKSGEQSIFTLDYFNTGDEVLDNYRKYDTECLIVGNFYLGEQSTEWLSYDLIMAYVMHHADVDTTPYYDWLYTTANDMPAANSYIAADRNGNLYSLFDLPDDIRYAYDLRTKMDYYFFHDN